MLYGKQPFIDSQEAADTVIANSSESDKVAIIGSEPQILFLSGRQSATGYLYMYPLVELHSFALQMQKELIHEIETEKPKIIILVSYSMSWMASPKSEKLIFEWSKKYVEENYKFIKKINSFEPEYMAIFVRK